MWKQVVMEGITVSCKMSFAVLMYYFSNHLHSIALLNKRNIKTVFNKYS